MKKAKPVRAWACIRVSGEIDLDWISADKRRLILVSGERVARVEIREVARKRKR